MEATWWATLSENLSWLATWWWATLSENLSWLATWCWATLSENLPWLTTWWATLSEHLYWWATLGENVSPLALVWKLFIFAAIVLIGMALLEIILILAYRYCMQLFTDSKLLRAGELLIEASTILSPRSRGVRSGRGRRGQRPRRGSDARASQIADGLLEDGKLLQKLGETRHWENRDAFVLPSRLSENDKRVLESSAEVRKLLQTAHDLLTIAINFELNNNTKENVTNLAKLIQFRKSSVIKCSPTWESSERLLYSLYCLVFRFTIKEVVIQKLNNGSIQHEYLLCGYRRPNRQCMLHVYFIAMLMVVSIWFMLVFIDNVYVYHHTTTCEDLDVKKCFFISSDALFPQGVNCTESDGDISGVICFDIAKSLSLASGFIGFVIVAIHILFKFTLWCVKNFIPSFAFMAYSFILFVYICSFLSYAAINLQISEIISDKYIMWNIKVLWGLATIILITLFSPYYWLIDRCRHEHRPVYSYHGQVSPQP